MEHSESALHFAVIDYLRGEIRQGKNIIRVQAPFPALLFTAPTGEQKDATEAFWAKRKGYLAGTPDILFWWCKTINRPDGSIIWDRISVNAAIELKSSTGTQSPAQREFQRKFEECNGKYTVCRTVAQVRDTLIAWGLECKNKQCIEPAPSAKQRLAMHTAPILEALQQRRMEREKLHD